MKLCPQCNFENIRNSFYCERCGTLLSGSSTVQPTKTRYVPHVHDYTVPSLEMYTPILPPPPSSLSYNILYPNQASEPPRAYITLHLLGRVILYLIATATASFGLFGFLTAFMSEAAATVGFLFLFISSIIALVIVLILHRSPYLRWWQRLLGVLAATGGIFVALLIGAAIVGSAPSTSPKADIVYGSVVIVYGIVLAAIALW